MLRVPVKPELLQWARERAGFEQATLSATFSKLPEWENGKLEPTLKQLEKFAQRVYVPIGYLLLSEPPTESVPITDFRTFEGRAVKRPSPSLLDTIHACQERQNWYRDYTLRSSMPKFDFIGRATRSTPPEAVAKEIEEVLDFDFDSRRKCTTWQEALRMFIRKVDASGILIMVNGVVDNNTQRRLDIEEFRGFALSDPYAPLIFVNGQDTKAAQIFTIAHELAHLCLGSSGLTNIRMERLHSVSSEEAWCNAVAAELLVPLRVLRIELNEKESTDDAIKRLSRFFKVSTLVVLRRLLDVGQLSRDEFAILWKEELNRLQGLVRASGGGNFYHTTLARVGNTFARTLIASTLEGNTLETDAFRMLGIKKSRTFKEMVDRVGLGAWYNI